MVQYEKRIQQIQIEYRNAQQLGFAIFSVATAMAIVLSITSADFPLGNFLLAVMTIGCVNAFSLIILKMDYHDKVRENRIYQEIHSLFARLGIEIETYNKQSSLYRVESTFGERFIVEPKQHEYCIYEEKC